MDKSEIKTLHDREWQGILSKTRYSLTHLGEEWRIEQLAERLCLFSKKYSSYEETGFKHTFSKELGKFNLTNDTVRFQNLRTPYGTIPFIEVHLSTLSVYAGKNKYSYAMIVSDVDNPEVVDILYTRDTSRFYDTFPEVLKETISNYVRILNCSVRKLIND